MTKRQEVTRVLGFRVYEDLKWPHAPSANTTEPALAGATLATYQEQQSPMAGFDWVTSTTKGGKLGG